MDPNYYDQSSSFFLASPPQNPLADPINIQNAQMQSASMQNASIPNPPIPNPPLDDISGSHHNQPRHDEFARRLRGRNERPPRNATSRYPNPVPHQQPSASSSSDTDPVQKLLGLLGENGQYVQRYTDLSRKIDEQGKQYQQEIAKMRRDMKLISDNFRQRKEEYDALKRALEHAIREFSRQLYGEEDVPGGMDTPT